MTAAFALLGCAVAAWSAAPQRPAAAVVTIVDGDATMVRGATRYALAEGVRLRTEDIVETGSEARLLRLESVEGDALELGPATRLMLAPSLPASRSRVPARAYLLQGWVKWTARTAPPGALLSAAVDVDGLGRSAVVAQLEGNAFVFAENGDLALVEHAGGRDATLALPSGRFFARSGEGAGSITGRPSADFMSRLPRPFVDTLPARIALFAAKDTPPRALGDIEYAEVQPWLDAEPALRRGFVARWRTRAAAPAFRKGLVAGLASHPEWDRTLYPEKYLPKRPPTESRTP